MTGFFAEERPLAAGREAGAAPTQQAGGVHLVGHGLGRHRERLAQSLVAAGGEIPLQRVRVVVPEPRRDDFGGFGDRHQDAPSPVFAAGFCHGRRFGPRGLRLGHGGPLVRDRRPVGFEPHCPAHPHQGAVRGHGVLECPAAQVGQQPVEALRRLAADVAVVDLHARRAVAVGQALGLLQGEHAVGRRAAGPHPERRLRVLEELLGATQQAGDVRADRHHVGAHRLGVQHVVERRRAPHLGRGHPDELGDLAHGLGTQPAVLLLGQVAQRDQRRARLGVESDQSPRLLQQIGRQVAHRSTSPMTGSTDEITATASAMSPPRNKTGSACRLTKLGPRMCIR